MSSLTFNGLFRLFRRLRDAIFPVFTDFWLVSFPTFFSAPTHLQAHTHTRTQTARIYGMYV